jgi:hypothetical protein
MIKMSNLTELYMDNRPINIQDLKIGTRLKITKYTNIVNFLKKPFPIGSTVIMHDKEKHINSDFKCSFCRLDTYCMHIGISIESDNVNCILAYRLKTMDGKSIK